MELDALKEQFVAITNKPRTRERAMRAAVAAASQHNLLYGERVGIPVRNGIRACWMSRLDELASKYIGTVSASTYEDDIETLRADMNRRFGYYFACGDHPRYRYEAGFRVSHAQKSLSVYLKHLWCLGELNAPPECPVDSVVLGRAGLVYPETRWAFVNTMEQHRRQIAVLATKAAEAGLSLAEWELAAWSD